MGNAAPAYRSPERYSESYPERAPRRTPNIEVVPGQRPQRSSETISPSAILVVRIVAVFFVVFALLGFVRIGLASATVTTAVATEAVQGQIETARTNGNELEVRESYLSNPTHLKSEATKLNMAASAQTTAIVLDADIVTTDDSGNLSLVGTLKAATQG